MCAQAGLEVRRLIRIAEGGFRLSDVKSGCWRYLTARELKLLKCNNYCENVGIE